MVIAHGLGLEAQFRETFRQIARRRAPIMAADSIPKDQLLKDEEVADKPDPHVWMDPKLWITVVRAVSERSPPPTSEPPQGDAGPPRHDHQARGPRRLCRPGALVRRARAADARHRP